MAAEAVGSSAFTGLFRSAVRDVHRTVFDRDQATVTLTVADVGTVLAEALEVARPGVAREVRATERVAVVRRDLGDVGSELADVADKVRFLSVLLLVLAAAAAAGALAPSSDRRATAVELGAGAAGGGVLLVVALGVLRSLALDSVDGPEARAAAGAVWDAYLVDLRTAAWILAGCGCCCGGGGIVLPGAGAARRAAASRRRPACHRARAPAAALATRAQPDRGRGGPAGGARRRRTAAPDLAGAYLIYEGVSALLRLVPQPPEESAERRPRGRARRRLVPALAAVLIVALAISAFVGGGGTTVAAPGERPCNGHDELCGKSIDELVLPATHNSMAVPLPGWFAAEQDAPIADQLDDGVRGLLIDTHYGVRLPGGRVRTELVERSKPQAAVNEDGISQESLDAGLRIRDRLGFSGRASAACTCATPSARSARPRFPRCSRTCTTSSSPIPTSSWWS